MNFPLTFIKAMSSRSGEKSLLSKLPTYKKFRFGKETNLMHKKDDNFSCAHKIWMNHNFLNGMMIFKWRFSISGIFGIWHDFNVSHFCLCKFAKTMCCSNHKMGRNNWSTAEIVSWVSLTIIVWVMKWYHKAPLFFWGRKSVITYVSKDTFQKKNLPKSVTSLPLIILLSIAMIKWRPKQKRKTIWHNMFSL